MLSLLALSNTFIQRMNRRWLAVFALVTLIIFMAGCENQMSTQRGVISGLVLDESGNRITGALVTSHRSLYKAETDENGHYEFTSLDVGSHRLTVERNGFYLASRTIELGYGQVLESINITVKNLPDLIKVQVSVREKDRAVLEVECAESMSVIAAWRQVGAARLQTMPTQHALLHQIELKGLFPGADYLVQIEGTTTDGRKFVSDQISFVTVNPLDVSGAPAVPENFRLNQSPEGPILSWSYGGLDSLEGYRIYRAIDDGAMQKIFDEGYLFAAQNSVTDDTTEPGRLYRYAIQSVDHEGNISSLTPELSIIPAGKIRQDLTWKVAHSPIRLNGDLTIPAGRTLTIEAGVNLVISGIDDGKTGYKRDSCEFIVEGTLLAEGSADAPIRMISASSSPTRTDWDGVRIIASSLQNPSILRHIEVAGAEKGIALYNSQVQAENLLVRYCKTGVSLNGLTGVTVGNIESHECETGIYVESTLDCNLNDLIIRDAENGMILLGNKNLSVSRFDVRDAAKTAVKTGDREGLKLRNGVLHALVTGLDAGGAVSDYQYLTIDAPAGVVVNGADVPVIKNCIVYNRQKPGTGYGIEDKTPGRSYAYNMIFNYSTATFNCDQNGGPIQNIDPSFVGGSGEYDYHLRPGSPALTASERNGQIGAYGSDI